MHSALDAPVPATVVAVRVAAPWPRCERRVPQRLSRRFALVQAVGQKRRAARGVGVVERTVEWRQKRMIKNCEDVARSWARKQVGFRSISTSPVPASLVPARHF